MSLSEPSNTSTHLSGAELRPLTALPKPPNWFGLGHARLLAKPNLHARLEKMVLEYGAHFQLNVLGQPFLVTRDAENIQFILKKRPQSFRRYKRVTEIINEIGGRGVFSEEGEAWLRQRKVMAQALNNKHMRQFYPRLVNFTQQFKQRFDRHALTGNPIDVQREFMRYTVDVISSLAFGAESGRLVDRDLTIQHNLEKIFPTLMRRLTATVPYWRYFKLPQDYDFEQSMRIVHECIHQIIRQSRQKLAQQDQPISTNFLEAMLLAQITDENGKTQSSFSDSEIFGNVFTLLMAGEDTTANSLAWLMECLAHHPEVQLTLQAEADTILGEHLYPTDYAELEQFTYAEAVILECMRMKSVAPFLLLEANEDIVVNGIEIPKNAGLILLTRSAGMDSAAFDHPEQFKPARWLPNYPELHTPRAALAFGGGARFCPGRGLAMVEMKTVLAMLMRNFRIEPYQTNLVGEKLDFVMMPDNLCVRFHRRLKGR